MLKKHLFFLGAMFFASHACDAGGFVIPDGTTVTTTQNLNGPGDIGIVEYGGTINCAEQDGVSMNNINQAVRNDGVIIVTDTATGNISCIVENDANGMITNNGSLVIVDNKAAGPGLTDAGISVLNTTNVFATNNGSISIQGGEENAGIYNFTSPNGLIVNNGDITIDGVFGGNFGIAIDASPNSVVINNGNIFINDQGGPSGGISHVNESNVTITNNGKIIVSPQPTSLGNLGISNELATNTIVNNSGLILVIQPAGAFGQGIGNFTCANTLINNSGNIILFDVSGGGDSFVIGNNDSPNTTIINSGMIELKGAPNITDSAIWNNSANFTLINSGVIYSSGYAFFSSGTAPTLELLVGSNVQGPVHVENAALNLHVQSGLNLALTLDSTSVGFGNLSIQAPYVLDNDPVIVVVDQTGLAMQADMTADFADAFLGGLYLHHACNTPCQSHVWGEVLGSYRTRSAQSQTLPYTDWLAGYLVGYDLSLRKNACCLFAGYSYAQAQIRPSPQQANISLACIGAAYEGHLGQTVLGVASLGAYVDWNNHRTVMNNLAPVGMDGAHVDAQGGFVAAEASISRAIPCFFCAPLMNFTARYAGLFLGTYTEQGSLANLSVKNRNVGLLTTRLEMAFASKRFLGFVRPFAGVYGRYQVQGAKVQGVLLGQNVYFDQEGPLNLVAGIVGLKGKQFTGNFRKYFNCEVGFDNADSTRVLGELGVSF